MIDLATHPLDDYDPELDNDDSVLVGETPRPSFLAVAAATKRLTTAQRRGARERAVRAATVGYLNRENVHYTQGSRRWWGIAQKKHARTGGYPRYADCSGFTSWCLWDALSFYKGYPDIVNGVRWTGGFTGTQVLHGEQVKLDSLLTGDLIFYGGYFWRPAHVAIYVGHGRVISFGSENGPFLLSVGYRPIVQARRYIR